MLDQIEKIKFMEKMNTIQWFPNFPDKDDDWCVIAKKVYGLWWGPFNVYFRHICLEIDHKKFITRQDFLQIN